MNFVAQCCSSLFMYLRGNWAWKTSCKLTRNSTKRDRALCGEIWVLRTSSLMQRTCEILTLVGCFILGIVTRQAMRSAVEL